MSTLYPPPLSRLYLLAFDERHSFEHSLLGLAGPPTTDEAEVIRRMKTLIYTGFQLALRQGGRRDGNGVLVDEQYGTHVAAHALEDGPLLALSVEKNGQDEFDFEYGQDFGAHVETFDPAFTKVQVHYNPEGNAELNARQIERLARLTDWLQARGRRFLLELRVPSTQAQFDAVGGDRERYDVELRPSLVVRAMSELQAGGVEPDVWKIEGLDQPSDCANVVRQARTEGREHVSCIVLDHHAGWKRLERWLRVAGATPGFIGFSIGQTIWRNPLRALQDGRITAADAAQRISENYQRALITWDKAALCSPIQQVEASPS
ncbi:2-deoxy-5-keto-D-gluconate 6-phosphate aldolase domain-containing protein [Archangium lansingense]|uniref:2-deoxy-5-keto-D-gluconate 6-phosphate aldolase domain-containing protein n=1 Tax=Archangium lansingense TaxID=2995310 RepID=UPI003B805A8D